MTHTHLFSGPHDSQYPRHRISQNVHPQSNGKKRKRKKWSTSALGQYAVIQLRGITPLTDAWTDGVIIMISEGRRREEGKNNKMSLTGAIYQLLQMNQFTHPQKRLT